MILPPLNDHGCLGAITDTVRDLVARREPALVSLATELAAPAGVIRWLRALPQRDDIGQPSDGPRVQACAPPQRLRLPAPDPNCVERAALYVLLGELLDPSTPRRLATIDTPVGRHTLPVERDRPVVLDPRVPRNCAHAGLDAVTGTPLPADLAGGAAWVTRIATEPAARLPGGGRRLRNGQAALDGVAHGTPVAPPLADDTATVLALAAREAQRWGAAGAAVVARVAHAVVELAEATARVRGVLASAPSGVRNGAALSAAIPDALRAVVRAIGALGAQAAPAALQATLVTLGITPTMLGVFERELNREGLTLGALGRPAPPVTAFAALSREALARRTLERAGAA